MAIIVKPSMQKIWASTGSTAVPPDAKIASGWGYEMMPFEWENWIQNRNDTMLAHLNQRGIALWDAETEYQASGSYVLGSNGTVYRCLVTHTNADPVTDATGKWERAFATPTGVGASGTWAISVSGNAATATALQNARTINGVSFNGTANITVEPYVDGATTAAATYYVPYVNSSASGNLRLKSNASFSYNPSGNLAAVNISGNAATATKLATARTVSMTGDVTWSPGSFDGSANLSGAATLANSGVTAGTYQTATTIRPLTIDAKGRVTAVGVDTLITPAFSNITGKPTTLAGYGITDAQALDADLTAIAALTGTFGLLKKTSENTWTLDTNTYLTGNQTITVSGDATGSGTTAITLTLANSGVSAGTYTKLTVNAKGLVTAGTNLSASDIPALDTSKLTTGTLGVARGGTGLAASVQGGVLYGSSTSANAFTAAGTAKQLLQSNGTSAPTWVTPDMTYLPDAALKKSVKAASTANLTLSGTQTVDGIALVAGDRILVKDQTTQSQNGIYEVNASTWTRPADVDTASKLAGAFVNVDSGTVNGGLRFDTDFKTTDTLGTTAMTWQRVLDTGAASTTTPIVAGTGAVGTAVSYARADHVHPAQTTVSGNAGSATILQTARSITATGDASWTVSFNGSANVSAALTLANSGVTAGTYKSVTVDAKGRVTAGTNPTTLAGYGITDAQALDADLTAIAALTGTSGLLRKTAADTWELDTNTYLTGNQTISVTGDATGSGTTSIAVTLANSGVTAGTYNDTATTVTPFTVDAKGRITGTAAPVTITPGWASITGKPTTLSGYGITDAQPLDAELTALAGLTTNGIIVKSAAGTALTRTIAVSGNGLSITNADGVAGNPTITINATSANTASAVVARDASGNFSAGTITAALSGNATTATTLQTARTISLTGDATGSVSFNGSANAAIATTLANSGVTAGTYKSVTVDAKGRVTAGTNPTTLAGYGITDAIPASQKGAANGVATLDASGLIPSSQLPSFVDDVLEYANLAGFPATGETSKIYIALDTNKTYRWSGSVYVEISPTAGNADTATKLATPRSITATGDASWTVSFDGSANVSAALTLANSGATAGTYRSVTVDAKGRVTAGTNPTTLSGYGITDAQPLDADLTSIAGLAGTSGLLRKTAANTWSLDTNTYATTALSVAKDSSTGAAQMPAGTTAQQPVAGAGKLRFNTTLNKWEGSDGSSWSVLGAGTGAVGGGTDSVFYLNGQTVNTSYTIQAGLNAMSAGPITIANGAVVTIADGSTWTIV